MELKDQAVIVLQYLNKEACRGFRPLDATLKPIVCRLKEGYSLKDLLDVVDLKVRKWGTDPKMNEYLRPMTLFAKENFSNYIGEIPVGGKK